MLESHLWRCRGRGPVEGESPPERGGLMGGSEAGLGLRPLAQVTGQMMRTWKQQQVWEFAPCGLRAAPGLPLTVPGTETCSCDVALAAGPYLWPVPPLPTWCPASSWVSLASCRWPPCPCCSAAGWGRGRGGPEPGPHGQGTPAFRTLPRRLLNGVGRSWGEEGFASHPRSWAGFHGNRKDAS